MQPSCKPAIKSVTPVTFLDGAAYFSHWGSRTEIPDPDGAVKDILTMCNGRMTALEIGTEVARVHPQWQVTDVLAALSALSAAGFLENNQFKPTDVLDAYSMRRWDRNLSFFEVFANMGRSKFELQRSILDTKVVLLGVGGLGSHLLMDLAAVGVLDIRIVDFDTVDLSNLNRQITYTEADIGRVKIEAASERVRAFSPRMKVDPVRKRISSADDVRDLVAGYDVAISVVDRPTMTIHKWVNAGIAAAGVPTIFGGVDSARALYYTVLPGQSGCVECWTRSAVQADAINGKLLGAYAESAFEGDNAAFGPLVTVLTGLIMTEFVRLSTGVCPPVGTGRLQELSFHDSTSRVAETWQIDPTCVVCSASTAERAVMA